MQKQSPAGHPPNRLRELRSERGLKLYDLAATYRVDPATINRWETGHSTIPDDTKVALAKQFGVPVAYLMRWDEEPVSA